MQKSIVFNTSNKIITYRNTFFYNFFGQKKQVLEAIRERLNTQLKSFEGYGAEQTALLKKHVLLEKGNFVLYAVGEHAADAQEAFVKSL